MDARPWNQVLPGTGAPNDVWRWAPTTASDVTALRRQLRTALHDGARPPGADDGDVDRLLLVLEELTSNAVRHGHPPVQVVVASTDAGWLVDVSDGATSTPPRPAVGRDPANGGLGLFLIAELASAHGWTVEPDCKHVWAYVDRSTGPAGTTAPRPVDGPRGV